MSTLAVLDITALTISMVLATSLVLMVLGSGAKRALNRAFALFALAMAASALFDILRYLSLWLDVGNPSLLIELSYLAQVSMGVLLSVFTVHYLNRRTQRTDLVVGLGVVVVVGLCVPLFRHQLIANPKLDVNGIFDADLSAWGIIGVQVSVVYNVWSLVLFWQERRRTGEYYLALGVLILVGGFVLEGFMRFFVDIPITSITAALGVAILGYGIISRQLFNPLRELTEELERKVQERTRELEVAYAEVEKQVEERTAELQREVAERERAQAESLRLQQEIIEAQKQVLQELSTPIIPVMDRIIVMPLVGSIDSMRARDITRALLAGIRRHQAQVVILDITGVLIVDSGVANHLNKTIQAARLKGARTIVTGISDAVAETIVELGIDWGGIETLSDLQTGLAVALNSLGFRLIR